MSPRREPMPRAGVPFVDLRAMHEEVRGEIEASWRALVDRSAFVGGPAVQEFERRFAQYCGVPHCVGVASGTDALRLALQAVGVRPGELVVTVPNTFIATVEAMTQIGAAPVFVDVDPQSYNMDPDAVADYLTRRCGVRNGGLVDRETGRRVACLLPVHLYGQVADLDPLLELAGRFGLKLVEDACQAHGARHKGRLAGSLGHAAAFSFYPGKNLGAMGEAGAITTADPHVADRCRVLREHGQREKYVHVTAEGGNARLDPLQAVVLQAKLARLDAWNEARRRAAARYDRGLRTLDVVVPREMPYAHHVYHLYVIQVDHRQNVRQALEEAKVGVGLHYPIPLHLQEAYRDLGFGPGSFPHSEGLAQRCLSLPMFPHLTDGQVDEVVGAVSAGLAPVRARARSS